MRHGSGADAGEFGSTSHLNPSLVFRHELSGLTFFQRENGTERLSAYRFHASDPLAFNGGGRLLWWVGSCKPLGAQQQQGVTKCGNPVPPLPPTLRHHQERETPAAVEASGRQLSPVNVTTYGWYYLF